MVRESKAETQARQRKENADRDAKTAKLKAARLAAEAKSKDALEQSAKRVAALYKSMREFEADAEAKAGFELKKAAEKRAALDQALVEARELCKAAGKDFKAFHEKYAPDYKRTRLYQVLAIADGRKTTESIREEERERKRRQRASVRDKSDVPDDPAERTTLELPPNGGGSRPILKASAEKSIEQVQDEFAALAAGEEAAIAGSAEIDAEARKAADDAVRAGETPPGDEAPTTGNGHTANVKPDDDRSLAEKLHSALNDVWSLCQDQNNWSHLNEDQKVELRGGMTKLGYLRELLPRLATPTVH